MRNAHGFSAKQEKSCSLYGFSPSRFLLDAGLFFISLTSLTHCPFSVCRNSSAAMLLAEERELTENASLQREKRHRLPFHHSLFPPSPFFPLFPFLFHPFFPPFPPLLLPSLSSRGSKRMRFFPHRIRSLSPWRNPILPSLRQLTIPHADSAEQCNTPIFYVIL